MNLRAHHVLASLLAAAVVFGSLAVLTVNPPAAQAACPAGSGVVITSPITATGPQSGIITVKAQSTPTTATGLSFMLMNPTQQAIGEATQSSTTWDLSWDTRNQPNGSYQLMAVAHFGTATTLDCASAVMPVYISNVPTQAPALAASINPNTWQGPLGASAAFTVDALYTDQYGRHSHVNPTSVNWHSSFGGVAPNGGISTVFTAGAVTSSGVLLADVFYNGLGAPGSAQIKILPPGTTTSPTPTPTPSPTPATTTPGATPSPTPAPVSAADATRLAAMPTIFRPADPTNSDPVVSIPTLSCLEKTVGTVRFSEISSGKSQPTAAERKLAAGCFSGPDQIPAVLAPVAPAHITELDATSGIITLGMVKNQTTTSKDGQKISGLLVTGTAAPNSNVFLYFFSDPLVLRAQTDSHGVWSYVLETPLKSGHHEVYAVTEKDAGTFVRTSAVPISIAAAAPGSQDGSLVIERGWSSAQIGFAALAALMVVAAIGVLFSILRRRRHLTAGPAVAPDTIAMPGAPAAAPVPVTPGLIMPTTPPVPKVVEMAEPHTGSTEETGSVRPPAAELSLQQNPDAPVTPAQQKADTAATPSTPPAPSTPTPPTPPTDAPQA